MTYAHELGNKMNTRCTDALAQISIDLKNKYAQWRVCEKLEPLVTEHPLITGFKYLFNRNYKPKKDMWWTGRRIVDAEGIRRTTVATLYSNEILFVDVFVELVTPLGEAHIYVLFEDGTYGTLVFGNL